MDTKLSCVFIGNSNLTRWPVFSVVQFGIPEQVTSFNHVVL